MDHAELGLAAPADDGHDPVAHREPLRPRAEGRDLTGQLETGDVGRRTRRSRVEAPHLEPVGGVDPGGVDLHEHLSGTGYRVGVLLPLEGTVEDRGCTHGPVPLLGSATSRPGG